MSHLQHDEEAAIAATLLLLQKAAGGSREPGRVPRWFEGWEGEIRKRLAAYFAASRRRALEAIGDEAPSSLTLVRIEHALIDQQASDVLVGHLAEAFTETAKLAVKEGNRIAQEVLAYHAQKAAGGYGSSLDQANARAIAWGGRYAAQKVTAINAATKKMIREGVVAAIESGASTDDLAEVLSDDLGFSDSRALMIARTELAFANSYGDLEGYRAAGLTEKEWQVSDQEVCDECLNHDGEVLPLDQDFIFDFSTSKTQRIVPVACPPSHPNCRCNLLPVTPYDLPSVRRPKPKPAPPAPKPPPPPPPAKPAAPPAPTPVTAPPPMAPPTEPDAALAQITILMPQLLGAETYNKPTVHMAAPEVPYSAAMRTWTGEILMGVSGSNKLRTAIAMGQNNDPLNAEAAEGLKMLLHEIIHGSGSYRRPMPAKPGAPYDTDSAFRGTRGYANAKEYLTPVGLWLEESTTELLAVKKWPEFARAMGLRLPDDMSSLPRRENKNGILDSYFDPYPREEMRMEALAMTAVGERFVPGGLTPTSLEFIRKLALIAPPERVSYLAKTLAKDSALGEPAMRPEVERLLGLWLRNRAPTLDAPALVNELKALLKARTLAEVMLVARRSSST